MESHEYYGNRGSLYSLERERFERMRYEEIMRQQRLMEEKTREMKTALAEEFNKPKKKKTVRAGVSDNEIYYSLI